MQNRWKSPVLWTAVISAVILVGSNLLKFDLDDSAVGQIVTVILGLMVALGIVNNPQNPNGV